MVAKVVKPVVKFKAYDQNQYVSMPINVSSFVPDGHLARIINEIVEKLSLNDLEVYYPGGGSSSYHPKLLIKVWLYGYCTRVYTSRPLSKALSEQLPFIWLAGGERPCFKTLSSFRGQRMQGLIDSVFKTVLCTLVDLGYIDLSDLYVDGSKWEANANKHKVVWAKNTERYKLAVIERIDALFSEISALQVAEDAFYGSRHLPSMGEGQSVSVVLNSEQVRTCLVDLNTLIGEAAQNESDKQGRADLRKAAKLSNDLGKEVLKLAKYEAQEAVLHGRNSYSKTDEDATMLRLKDEQLLPAYNVQHSTQHQYVLNYTIAQNASDSPTLPEHLAKFEERLEGLPKPDKPNLVGDAGYGSEENYAEMEKRQLENYVKYPLFYQEQTGELAKAKFRRENFPYDTLTDTFTCPNDRQLVFHHEQTVPTKTGYERQIRVYQCENCQECPFAAECKKTEDKERTVQMSPKGEAYKEQAKQNLLTPQGKELRAQRGIEVESAFGDIKYNMKHERFLLRSIEKVYVEYGLLAIAHNIRKIYCKQSGIWEDYYAQRAAKKEKNTKKRA